MYYLGIFFLLIGAWQAFMKGRLSPVISGISLTLGTLLVFIAYWQAGLFFIFLIVSWFFLMQIFRFSTFHRYFLKAAPFLIGYGALIAFLLVQFHFHKIFWLYLFLIVLFLLINHRKQHQAKHLLNLFSGEDTENRIVADISLKRTIKYHLLSSAVFVVSFVLAFAYFAGGITTNQIIPQLIPWVSVSNDTIEHYSKSINFANQATKISNTGEAYQQISEGEMGAMTDNYQLALAEARQVDTNKLNSMYSGLGDHYKNEFIAGIEMFINGFEKSDSDQFLQGQMLLSRWGDWYNQNREEIRKL